jgi:hypothetical protein
MARVPNRYDSFPFPPYQFREFPKWVTPKDAEGNKLPPVMVEDRDEERLVLQKLKPVLEMVTETAEVDLTQTAPEQEYVEEPKVPLTSEELLAGDEVVMLRKRAAELNIVFSDRWGVTKLRRAIQEAQNAGQA